MSSYHHGNLRASLVEAAVGLARADGPAGVVLREVARRAGVSHNAAYRHFADREALLAAVALAGMEELGSSMSHDLADLEPPRTAPAAMARLRATGRSYVRFALTEPGLFRTAFGACPDPREVTEAEPPVDAAPPHDPFAILVAAVDDLVTVGRLPAERRDGVVMTCWAAVHGFAQLHLEGPLRGVPETARGAALEELLDEVERVVG